MWLLIIWLLIYWQAGFFESFAVDRFCMATRSEIQDKEATGIFLSWPNGTHNRQVQEVQQDITVTKQYWNEKRMCIDWHWWDLISKKIFHFRNTEPCYQNLHMILMTKVTSLSRLPSLTKGTITGNGHENRPANSPELKPTENLWSIVKRKNIYMRE